jgi:hypothetical protein
MSFAVAEKVANAVLYEGYVLYPYRASSAKNRVRFQFGVVAPHAYVAAGGADPCEMQTQCLVEPAAPGGAPRVDIKIRFLQLQARSVEAVAADGNGFQAVDFLDLGGERVVAWDEGVECELEAAGIALRDLVGADRLIPLAAAGGREVEELRDADGEPRGRLVRQRWPLAAAVRLAVEEAGEAGLLRLTVRIDNQSEWPAGAALDRDRALRRSLLGAHTLLAVHDGAFVSLLDPPPAAAAAAAGCANLHTWPVLIGEPGSRDVMLSSPIILYDHPAVAPESPGDLCDSTEIDEILLLRIMTLTEDEKREARGTDERARQILARADSMPPELFERLHGAVRSLTPSPPAGEVEMPWQAAAAARPELAIEWPELATPRDELAEPSPPAAPASGQIGGGPIGGGLASWESFLNPPGTPTPEEATIEVGGVRLGSGSRVRLRPTRRADSMDLFLAGRIACVAAVYRDLEERAHLAVTLEDDPAGAFHAGVGRFFYFYPDEVEPLADAASPAIDGEGGGATADAKGEHEHG